MNYRIKPISIKIKQSKDATSNLIVYRIEKKVFLMGWMIETVFVDQKAAQRYLDLIQRGY